MPRTRKNIRKYRREIFEELDKPTNLDILDEVFGVFVGFALFEFVTSYRAEYTSNLWIYIAISGPVLISIWLRRQLEIHFFQNIYRDDFKGLRRIIKTLFRMNKFFIPLLIALPLNAALILVLLQPGVPSWNTPLGELVLIYVAGIYFWITLRGLVRFVFDQPYIQADKKK